ncbi:154_t:CDS:2, partial [Racocetra persica]
VEVRNLTYCVPTNLFMDLISDGANNKLYVAKARQKCVIEILLELLLEGLIIKMDHGDHGFKCSMKMLFNWDYTNLCIVFSWWKVNGITLLLLSCVIVGALGAFYEILRYWSRKYDEKICEAGYRQISNNDNEEENTPNSVKRSIRLTRSQQLIRVVIGTGIGFFFFGKQTLSRIDEDDRIAGCH